MKTSELTGAALDWAVAIALKKSVITHAPNARHFNNKSEIHCSSYGCTLGARSSTSFGNQEWSPSTDWAITGSLIDEYKPDLLCSEGKFCVWFFNDDMDSEQVVGGHGETYLIAFCRGLVEMLLGPDIHVPDILGGNSGD